MKKIVLIIFVISVILVSTGGYYDAKEIAHTVSVIAVGIDKGENMPYRVSFQIERTGTGEGENGEEKNDINKEKSRDVLVVEAPTVLSAFSRANSVNSVDLSLNNVKMVIFSSELSKEGIYKSVSELSSATEFKNNSYLAVSVGRAEDILKNVSPEDEEYISVYYEQIILRHYQASTRFFLLSETYFNMLSDGGEFLLPLVAKREEDGFENSFEDDIKSDLVAGLIPKESKHKVEFLGGAVFSDGKLMGYLTESEMLALSFAGGFFAPRDISVEYPENSGEYVILRLKQQNKSKIKTEAEDILSAKIEVELSGNFEFMPQGKYDSFRTDFSRFLEKEIEKDIENVINKCLKEYSSDVLGIGNYGKIHFMTNKKLKEYNFNEKAKNMEIKVKVRLETERNGRFTFL